jgi:hypothetical protein
MELATILFHAHSGLRYLVLLAGVLSVGYSLIAMLRNAAWDRPGRILQVSFVGVMDLQVLLGIILALVHTFYPALWGHLTMMILAAVVGHIAAGINKRRAPEGASHRIALLGSAAALILIVGGIMAIGRSVV